MPQTVKIVYKLMNWLVAPVISCAPRLRLLFRDRLCFASSCVPGGRFTGGHVLVPVYVWTAPGPYVRGGLPHILLLPARVSSDEGLEWF
jgi:hypothetical protein